MQGQELPLLAGIGCGQTGSRQVPWRTGCTPILTPPLLYLAQSYSISPNHTVFELDTSMCWFHGCYQGRYILDNHTEFGPLSCVDFMDVITGQGFLQARFGGRLPPPPPQNQLLPPKIFTDFFTEIFIHPETPTPRLLPPPPKSFNSPPPQKVKSCRKPCGGYGKLSCVYFMDVTMRDVTPTDGEWVVV